MINQTWDNFLNEQFQQDYFKQLSSFLRQEYQDYTVYPKKEEVFSAFYYTDLDKVKVVIVGQDPYHEVNQACGLAFAVKDKVALPPSLKNIYQEIENDLHIKMSNSGFLLPWAKQGVLLLNATLTVREHQANSHQDKGWSIFTDNVIKYLEQQDQPIVYLLWGNFAINKKALITNENHLILTAAHPSPLSAYHGFFGCRHFSKTNDFLKSKGLSEIDWRI